MKYIATTLFLFLTWNSFSQKVKVNTIIIESNFDSISMSKLNESSIILEKIINSEEFKTEVLKEKFRIGNNKLSSQEIYDLIITGKDNYKNKPSDYSIDLRVKLFDEYAGSGNFGFTDMNTRITRTHRCYIIENDTKCYTSHLAHEYMHQIGFIDKRNIFLKKTNSVPYKIGRIIDKLIDNKSHCVAIKSTCKN